MTSSGRIGIESQGISAFMFQRPAPRPVDEFTGARNVAAHDGQPDPTLLPVFPTHDCSHTPVDSSTPKLQFPSRINSAPLLFRSYRTAFAAMSPIVTQMETRRNSASFFFEIIKQFGVKHSNCRKDTKDDDCIRTHRHQSPSLLVANFTAHRKELLHGRKKKTEPGRISCVETNQQLFVRRAYRNAQPCPCV